MEFFSSKQPFDGPVMILESEDELNWMKYLQISLPDTVRGLDLFCAIVPPKSRGVAQCVDLNKLFLKLCIFQNLKVTDLQVKWGEEQERDVQ